MAVVMTGLFLLNHLLKELATLRLPDDIQKASPLVRAHFLVHLPFFPRKFGQACASIGEFVRGKWTEITQALLSALQTAMKST